MKREICFVLMFIFMLVALPLYAYEPNQCTRCILGNRPDILPFYKQNGWDISQWNWDNIIANWCGIDPNGCALEKEKCWEACNPTPMPCTQCILGHRQDILPNFASWGWDVSEANWNGIIVHWCGLDPNGCEAEKQNCGESCGITPPPSSAPTPSTQCILSKHPEILNPPSLTGKMTYSSEDQNEIVGKWCSSSKEHLQECTDSLMNCGIACDKITPYATPCTKCIMWNHGEILDIYLYDYPDLIKDKKYNWMIADWCAKNSEDCVIAMTECEYECTSICNPRDNLVVMYAAYLNDIGRWKDFCEKNDAWDPTVFGACTNIIGEPIECMPCQTYASWIWYLSGIMEMEIPTKENFEVDKLLNWYMQNKNLFVGYSHGGPWEGVLQFYGMSQRRGYKSEEFGTGVTTTTCYQDEINNVCESYPDNEAKKEFENLLHIGDIVQYYGYVGGEYTYRYKHSVIVIGHRRGDNKPLVASFGYPNAIGFPWDKINSVYVNPKTGLYDFDYQKVRVIHAPASDSCGFFSISLQSGEINALIDDSSNNVIKAQASPIAIRSNSDTIQAQVGQTIKFDSNVINSGNLDADEPVDVRWTINNNQVKLESAGMLKADSQYASFLEWKFDEPGEYMVAFEINVGTKKAKDDITIDDKVTLLVIVTNPELLPDLKANPVTHEPAIISLGKEIRFRSGINNIGKVNAGAFRVKWSVNGQEILAKDYPNGCPANGSINDPPELKWTFTQLGTYRVAFTVDTESQVDEANEANNEAFIVITPNELLPDLKPLFPITHTPTQAVVGKQVRFQSGVNNVGKADAGVFYARWFINGKEVAYGKYPTGCKVGQTIVGEPGVLFWTPTAPGNYTITFEVDTGNQIKEESENNNTTSNMISVIKLLPDLKPLFPIRHTPTQAVVGQQVRFQSGVNNAGKADAGAFFARWFINGKEVAYGKYPAGCKVGQTIVGEPGVLFWTPTAPGNYAITFEVDTGNQVKEESENNNTTSNMISAKELLPDLKPVAPIGPPLAQIFVNKPFTFHSGAVNVGDKASGSFSVKWYVNGVERQTRRYAGCAVNQTLTGWAGDFTWTPTVAGSYTIRVEVDANKEVKEHNETNNTTFKTVAVKEPIPVAPSNLSAVALDSRRIRLTWRDNSNNETGFMISNRSREVSVGKNATYYIWTGLAPRQTMCFRVRSYNGTGFSAWTYEACATTRKAN